MKVSFKIPNQRIVDILESSSSRYWADMSHPKARFNIGAMMKGGKSSIVMLEIADEQEPFATHCVTREMIEKGIAILFENYPHLTEQILDEDKSDIYTGDYLLQCAIFGELKYS